MSLNFKELFPQLTQRQQHYFSDQQLQVMPYFRQISALMPQRDLTPYIKKSKKAFRLLTLKKGTILFTPNTPSLCGYFLCHGSVSLLTKKTNRQKLEPYPRHILHQVEERCQYLNEEFGIPLELCEHLMEEFYEQKVLFRYLEYQKVYGQGYFGFSDMVKGGGRVFMTVVTQDSVLLEMEKGGFEGSLKELEVKKEDFIVKSIIENVIETNTSINSQQNTSTSSSSLPQQLFLKLSQSFNHFTLRTFDKDDLIFKQSHPCYSLYFILKGQVELSKQFPMDIPKKLIKDENKPHFAKEIEVKVSRLSEKCYLGEVQYLLHARMREFTAKALENRTVLLQIEPAIFIKIISEFSTLEKDLTVSAKQKFSIATQNFLKQKNKVVKLFMQEFENIENKKKEKIISHLFVDDQGNRNAISGGHGGHGGNSMMFEIFSKEGMIFRDTYERLEGFEEFEQLQASNKRAAIRKYKVQTTHQKGSTILNNNHNETTLQSPYGISQHPSVSLNRLQHDQDFQAYNSKQKLLYSPKRNINIVDLMSSTPVSPVKKLHTSQQTTTKLYKKKSVGKFHELQKDEAVFRRVLIKNGRFSQDKTTFKSNIVKPIVHPKFDDIIKQCMGRKNQVIRKAIGDKRNEVVKDSYFTTVETLKNKSLSISKFSNVALTCKGTEEFKKKLQMFSKHHRKSDSTSGIRNRIAIESEQTLQACIGVNQPPKSSQQKSRPSLNQQQSDNQQQRFTTTISSSRNVGGFGQRSSVHLEQSGGGSNNNKTNGWIGRKSSPEKLVLLNHMMKPMTYSSVQF